MSARGAKTIRGLGRVFKCADDSGHRKVDVQEFFVGLNECGCSLTKEETDTLLSYFDTDHDGNINFDEFLVSLRGCPNAQRQAIIDAAYNKFDVTQEGAIVAADLRACYTCNAHPKVISGEITEDEAFLEFLANFGDKNNDGMITKTEWNDYYASVSSSIDNDDHFCALMTQAWKL